MTTVRERCEGLRARGTLAQRPAVRLQSRASIDLARILLWTAVAFARREPGASRVTYHYRWVISVTRSCAGATSAFFCVIYVTVTDGENWVALTLAHLLRFALSLETQFQLRQR